MAMAKSAVTVLSILTLFGAAMATSYDVGDSAGWTSKGSPDYKKWAEDKKFEVGDTLVFKYNQEMHDVMQVSKADYEACSAKSPIAKYSTGTDSLTLKEPGKMYFLCSYPGHCDIGQKLEIEVEGSAQSPAASPGKTASGAHASTPAASPGKTSGGADASTPAASPSKTAGGADASSPTASAAGEDSPTADASSESSSGFKLSGGLGWAVVSVGAVFAF